MMQKALSIIDVLKFTGSYWVRQPRKLVLILGLLVSASLLETYLPTALSVFLGAVRGQADHAVILSRLAVFVGVYLLQAVLFTTTYLFYNSFETRVFQTLVNDAFAHVQKLSEHFFASTFTGSIVSKINRARQKIENFEDQIIIRVFPTIIVLIGSTTFLAMRFPVLACVMVAYFLFFMVISAFFVFKISGPAQGRYATAQDSFIAHLADTVGGIPTTKAYAQEDYERDRFFDISRKLRKKNLRAYTLSNLAGLMQRLLSAGMLILLLGGGMWYLFHGRATVEDMAYLVFAYTIAQSYIRDLGENIKNILTSSYDLHAVITLMREPPETEAGMPVLDVRHGAIRFENVSFAYPGQTKLVFDTFSLSIKHGERVALVGHSGSGKTTFVRLLLGLYKAQKGRILIDGEDISQHSRASLRSAIALVPQDPVLFHRTLAENIAYAKPEASMDEIHAAAKQAHAVNFIERLPKKYETLVGERGIKLSGGERQRVAIARAILANRPILVLDEATSSLDSVSEQAIQNALKTLTQGRTAIMIAHRLSTIINADRILVFDNGKIAEEGTHAELVARDDGIYAGFFRLQAGGFGMENFEA